MITFYWGAHKELWTYLAASARKLEYPAARESYDKQTWPDLLAWEKRLGSLTGTCFACEAASQLYTHNSIVQNNDDAQLWGKRHRAFWYCFYCPLRWPTKYCFHVKGLFKKWRTFATAPTYTLPENWRSQLIRLATRIANLELSPTWRDHPLCAVSMETDPYNIEP